MPAIIVAIHPVVPFIQDDELDKGKERIYKIRGGVGGLIAGFACLQSPGVPLHDVVPVAGDAAVWDDSGRWIRPRFAELWNRRRESVLPGVSTGVRGAVFSPRMGAVGLRSGHGPRERSVPPHKGPPRRRDPAKLGVAAARRRGNRRRARNPRSIAPKSCGGGAAEGKSEAPRGPGAVALAGMVRSRR